jgi:site-specific recombinase XerD
MITSIKPYVDGKTNCVYFIISYKKKRFQVSTGMRSSEKFSGLVFPNSTPNSTAKTARLASLYSSIDAYMEKHLDEPFELMRRNIKAIINGEEPQSGQSLVHYFEEFMETKINESTRGIYETTRKRLVMYDEKALIDDIDRRWLDGFLAHEIMRGRKMNGIAIDFRNMRAVFNWAIDNEETKNYPFRKFTIKTERQKFLYLSIEEMREYRDIEVEDFMEKYRDMFLLGFYLIGINLSDLLELPANAIKHGRIVYRRKKTGRLYDIKVEPEALEIINKYHGTKHLVRFLDDGTKLSSFKRRLGDYIKRIGKVELVKNRRGALIKKQLKPLHDDIVWYTARRSWATIAASLDIPKEVIGKALGHSEWDSTTTDLYINFDNRKIDEANRKVINALNADLALSRTD